jgi:hypothetical protein
LIEYQPAARQGEKLDTIYKDENTVSAFSVTPIPTTNKPSEEQVENTDEKSPRCSRNGGGSSAASCRPPHVSRFVNRSGADML